MDMHLMNKKAFGLSSVLIVLLIMSVATVLVAVNYSDINLDKYVFINNYLYEQSDSLLNREEKEVYCKEASHSVSFNKDGKVNMGQTINFDNGDVVIHVGSGYITYE